jgi:hypothetical protein
MTTSNGMTVIKFGAEAEYEKLKVLNERVNTARKSLLERYGDKPEEELASINAVAQELAAVRKELTPMKSNGAPYKSVDENLSDANDWNESTRRGLASQQAIKERESRVLAEPGLTPQELDATETIVKAFTTNVRKEWKNVADNHLKRMKELRDTTAAGPELRAKAKAEAERKLAEKAKEEARHNAQQARYQADQLQRKIQQTLERAEVPSEADIATLSELVQKIAAGDLDEAKRGEKLMLDARIVRALDQEAAGPAMQALFPGAVVTTGQTKGKALSVPLSVKKNHCAVFIGRFANFTGSELIKEQVLGAPGDGTAAQKFTMWATHAGNNSRVFELHGMCALRDVKGTVGAKLEFTGSKNGVRYVVLDFEKPAFPRLLASHLNIDMPDHCDPEAWSAMWLNPVPGSLGYLGGEPVVVSTDRAYFAGDPGESQSFDLDRLERAAPKSVKFTHQLKWKRCNLDYAEAPVSKQLKACSDKIDKRYESQWKSVERVRDVADGMSTSTWKYYSPAAEEKASRLRIAADKDWDRECQPIEDKMEKTFARRFEKLVDQLTDDKPVDVLYSAGK